LCSPSIAVYGQNQLPMTEELTPGSEDPYGIAKYAVELDLHEAHRMFGLPFVIFRPDNVYGERQNIGAQPRLRRGPDHRTVEVGRAAAEAKSAASERAGWRRGTRWSTSTPRTPKAPGLRGPGVEAAARRGRGLRFGRASTEPGRPGRS
jgi:NAD dependent epimerase/dehydratase family